MSISRVGRIWSECGVVDLGDRNDSENRLHDCWVTTKWTSIWPVAAPPRRASIVRNRPSILDVKIARCRLPGIDTERGTTLLQVNLAAVRLDA